jgi:DNA-binding IscR family transcriptional regulator
VARIGYALGRSAETITLLHVVNAVSAVERIRACPLGLKTHAALCPLHRELDNAYAAVEEAFSRVTAAQVLHQQGAVPPLCEIQR